MKIKSKYVTIAALAFWSVAISFSMLQSVSGQGFANLDFEQSTIAPAPSDYTPSDAYDPISASSALPYWIVTEDVTICTAIWGEPVALDETSVALVSAGAIQGSYSVELSAGIGGFDGYFLSSSISQTGFIPVGIHSIQFSITSPFPTSNGQPSPIVTLNGTPISLLELAQSGGVITMAGDVSSFAGTMATLAFLCEHTPNSGFAGNENYFNLDNIQFSPSSVPEPSEFALIALGALLFGFRRWQNSFR